MLAGLAAAAVNAEEKPNIIYILADDLGYGDLGCYGQQVIQTPNLDRMANEGMRFTRHYAGSTVCGPSRSCMLEGKHSGHTYVRGNGKLQMREDPHDLIFPKALQQAGYHTALIGKSGLGCNTDDASLLFKKASTISLASPRTLRRIGISQSICGVTMAALSAKLSIPKTRCMMAIITAVNSS